MRVAYHSVQTSEGKGKKMKRNLLVAVLIWAMLAALAIVSASARTGPSEHVFYPNGIF